MKTKRNLILKIGLALLVIGTGPLVLLMIFSPNSNPIGLGLLSMITFWPSIILIVIGLIIKLIEKVKNK